MPTETYLRGDAGCAAQLTDIITLIEASEPSTCITTDSDYVAGNICAGRIGNWISNGWKTRSGHDVKNKDLWVKLIALSAAKSISFKLTIID